MNGNNTTVYLGAGLLTVCLVCLTVLAGLKLIPPDVPTHLAATVSGGIIGIIVTPKTLAASRSIPPPADPPVRS